MGQSLFKKHSKFQNFDEIFYCGMTRLRNTNLDVFIQCQYTRTIIRNKNIGQSLFKKQSKFQKFDEILYCRMTRFSNVKLGVFRQYQNKNYFKKQKHGTASFYKNFQIPNEGKMNSVRLDMTYLKEVQQKMKMLDKLILKNI